MTTRTTIVAGALALVGLVALAAEEPVDLVSVTRIRDEGFANSRVMDTLAELTDVIGPRVTGSPQMKQANEWTRQQLQSWGLANAHLEPWGPFGRGWSFERAAVHMVAPTAAPLIALPRAWTPGTSGPQRGSAIKVKIEAEADIEKYKGQLAGKVVFLSEPRELKGPDKPLFTRYTEDQLADLEHFEITPGARRGVDREAAGRRFRLGRALRDFFVAEKVLATVEISSADGGVVSVARGGTWVKDENPGPPSLVMAAEHYNRIARLLDRKLPVELEVDVHATFYDEDPMAYNTIAEIPGSDRKGEVVMLGGHLDSWHAATGATDNAAGVAVAMEAVRILQALEIKPKRTIRIALWSGEEEGLLGSRAYARDHFASRPEPTDPKEKALPRFLRRETGPLTLKPEHARLSAYFNVDNGTGKIRGIYTERNAAVAPIFEAWLRPLADLGATAVTLRHTGGTDHESFDGVGLPGFQFIQDEADYETRTHHTNMDVYDRLQKEDLMQASVVLATFVYNAAMRDALMPRRPIPREVPVPSPADSASPAASPSPSPAAMASPMPTPTARKD